MLDVRALGQGAGLAWERSLVTAIGVAGRQAKLRAPHLLAIGPAQGHGSAAQIGVSAYAGGEYLLSVTVLDKDAQTVTKVAHPVHLEPGEHTIAVPIPATALASARDGDLALGEIVLLDISDAALLLDLTSGQASKAGIITQRPETDR
jgi:hypothetical protein